MSVCLALSVAGADGDAGTREFDSLAEGTDSSGRGGNSSFKNVLLQLEQRRALSPLAGDQSSASPSTLPSRRKRARSPDLPALASRPSATKGADPRRSKLEYSGMLVVLIEGLIVEFVSGSIPGLSPALVGFAGGKGGGASSKAFAYRSKLRSLYVRVVDALSAGSSISMCRGVASSSLYDMIYFDLKAGLLLEAFKPP